MGSVTCPNTYIPRRAEARTARQRPERGLLEKSSLVDGKKHKNLQNKEKERRSQAPEKERSILRCWRAHICSLQTTSGCRLTALCSVSMKSLMHACLESQNLSWDGSGR